MPGYYAQVLEGVGGEGEGGVFLGTLVCELVRDRGRDGWRGGTGRGRGRGVVAWCRGYGEVNL